jgi:hypothetical protein
MSIPSAVDRGVGERYRMPEVKRMVADDPSMLERFSNAEKREMVEDVLAKRRKKTQGTRANNLAAAADAKRTMDRLMTEVSRCLGVCMKVRGTSLTHDPDREPRRACRHDRIRDVLAGARP